LTKLKELGERQKAVDEIYERQTEFTGKKRGKVFCFSGSMGMSGFDVETGLRKLRT
jgi:hypothetical protein